MMNQYILVSILMAFTAVLAVLQMALRTYGHRCRHPALRFFQWGASAVFIPLTAYIISSYAAKIDIKNDDCFSFPFYMRYSQPPDLLFTTAFRKECIFTKLLIVWIVLIQIIKGDTDMASAAVVTEGLPVTGDAGGSRPSVELLAYSIWTTGLVLYYQIYASIYNPFVNLFMLLLCAPYAIQVAVKLVSFQRARGSFALGRNAKVIAGYMAQLYDEHEDHGQVADLDPLRYIVMGEEKRHLEKTPHGYRIKDSALQGSTLVTLDRIWRLSSSGDPLLVAQPQLKDLCLSFSLFKSLRRGFEGYPLAEAGSPRALPFVLQGMLGEKDDHERMFRIVGNELAFATDFYFSSLPWSFSGRWFASLNFLLSTIIVAWLVLLAYQYFIRATAKLRDSGGTMAYYSGDSGGTMASYSGDSGGIKVYYFITFLLNVAAIVIKLWVVISSMCSNWTKLALLHYYIRNTPGYHRYSLIYKILAVVLRFKAVQRFNDRIGQNSMLEPRRFYNPPDIFPEKMSHRASLLKSVKVPPEVKAAVLTSLTSNGGKLSNGTAAVHRSELRDIIIWSCRGEGAADVILVWHIATSLFEQKYLQPSSPKTTEMITATHLSQYCAYLVAAVPELLPDDATWTKGQYKAVAKDIGEALGHDGRYSSASMAGDGYDRCVQALGESSRHTVLKKSLELAKQLVGKVERQEGEGEAGGESPVWELLAEFWSEMVLYVAPSDNGKAHIEALARGGEFITLLWALLQHAGITARPGDVPEP